MLVEVKVYPDFSHMYIFLRKTLYGVLKLFCFHTYASYYVSFIVLENTLWMPLPLGSSTTAFVVHFFFYPLYSVLLGISRDVWGFNILYYLDVMITYNTITQLLWRMVMFKLMVQNRWCLKQTFTLHSLNKVTGILGSK